MQQYKLSQFNILKSSLVAKFFVLCTFVSVFVYSSPVWADEPSMGDAIVNLIDSSAGLPGLISGVSYLVGLVFGVLGILKMRDHVLNPTQVQLNEPLKYFIAGGALFALPMISLVLYNSLTDGGGLDGLEYSGFSGSTSGGGLDTMLVDLVKDIWLPMHGLVSAFGYLAGLVFMMIGILRLVKTSQDGARGPAGFGTIMTFFTAAALFSLDQLMGALSFSIFGDATAATLAKMSYVKNGGVDTVVANHAHAVISAIVGFVAIVGWISFLRGWFLLRGVAEGSQQASMMAATTHIIAGALCVNIGGVLNAIQETLKIVDIGVAFG